MSEPTYRVELTHHPVNGAAVAWRAVVYGAADDTSYLYDCYGASREAAFDNVQGWVRAYSEEPEHPSTVFLTEDGDILDPHEVQR